MSPEPPMDLFATILLLDSPTQLRLGLDYCMWTVGPKFMGIRLIPPGPHFLYWSPPDEHDVDVLGVTLHLNPKEVAVRRWSTATDAFEELDADEAERYVLGVARGDFILNLGPYPEKYAGRWSELSRYITKDVIQRIEPTRKFVGTLTKEYDETDAKRVVRFKECPGKEKTDISADSAAALEPHSWNPTLENGLPVLRSCLKSSLSSSSSAEGVEQYDGQAVTAQTTSSVGAVHLEKNDPTVHFGSDTLFFCDIPRPWIPSGISAEEKTLLFMDKSDVLQRIVQKQLKGDATQLLGEVQLAFIWFLLGQNYLAFEQWKNLLTLLCHCDAALDEYPTLFTEFLRILHSHLLQAPPDFVQDALTSGNFLIQSVMTFCEIADSHQKTLPPLFYTRLKYIKNLLVKKFKFSPSSLFLDTTASAANGQGENAPSLPVTAEEARTLLASKAFYGCTGQDDEPTVVDLNEGFISLTDSTPDRLLPSANEEDKSIPYERSNGGHMLTEAETEVALPNSLETSIF